MNKIKLTHITLPDKKSWLTKNHKYSVSLGNKVVKLFPSERKAQDFLVETNRFLNDIIQELNIVYAQVFYEYRRAWFHTEPDSERDFRSAIEAIDKAFRMAVGRSHYENGNHFTFITIQNICTELTKVLNSLKNLSINKNIGTEQHVCNALSMRIESISTQIDNYGRYIVVKKEIKKSNTQNNQTVNFNKNILKYG